ncbi:MAG: hypothetical protein AAF493_13070 [Pseudomonadota bacterium]
MEKASAGFLRDGICQAEVAMLGTLDGDGVSVYRPSDGELAPWRERGSVSHQTLVAEIGGEAPDSWAKRKDAVVACR